MGIAAIRDGVVAVYEAFQHGVPLELAIAELGAAKAEAEARRQAEALASQPSNCSPAFHLPQQPVDLSRLTGPAWSATTSSTNSAATQLDGHGLRGHPP